MAASWANVPASQLNSYVVGSANAGYSFSTIAGGSPTSGPGKSLIASLKKAGWSTSAIQALEKGPSTLRQLIDQVGMSAVIPPLGSVAEGLAAGPAATTAEGTAAAGATAGSAAGYASKALSSLSTLAKAGGIAALLVDPSFLWRLVKIVGGLALAYLGIKQLATAGTAR